MLPFLGWYFTGLFDLDEGFYGAITREMNRRHEWITPFYNGKPWFEKPILVYWLMKPCVAMFGIWIGPRLPSVLSAIGVMVLCARFVQQKFDEQSAQLTVLILASSAYFVAVGRLAMTDMPLLFAFTAAMFCFWRSLDGEPKQRIWCAFWLGVGVLAKGPVVWILFTPIAAIAWWRLDAVRPHFRGYWVAGVAVMGAVVSCWYVPAYLANGHEFVQKFLIEQNIGRFTGGDAAHSAGLKALPMYAVVLFLGMMPWCIWAARSAWQCLRSNSDNLLGTYLAIWASVVFLFFTISSAKLPHYVLPCVPPLAILAARGLVALRWPIGLAQALAFAWAIGLNFAQIAWYDASGQAEAHRAAGYIREHFNAADVAFYQLSKQELKQGHASSLAETSLPSMLFYLNSNVFESDNWDEILDQKKQVIFTRTGRVGEPEMKALSRRGLGLHIVGELDPTLHYIVYTIIPDEVKKQ